VAGKWLTREGGEERRQRSACLYSEPRQGDRKTALPLTAMPRAANKRDEFASFHWITSRQATTVGQDGRNR
jgi:hypothetical protein